MKTLGNAHKDKAQWSFNQQGTQLMQVWPLYTNKKEEGKHLSVPGWLKRRPGSDNWESHVQSYATCLAHLAPSL